MSERALAKVKILLRSSPIKSGSKSTETVALAGEVAQVCLLVTNICDPASS